MELFKCIIELPAFPIKKNSKALYKNRRTGKMFIGTNKKALDLTDFLLRELIKAKHMAKLETIECDVNVSFQFFYPMRSFFTKKNIRNAKLADLSNLIQGPEDALQKAGILKNDNIICSLDNSGRFAIDSTNHKLRIVIAKKEN